MKRREEMSEYEMERARTIAHNNEVLASLGLAPLISTRLPPPSHSQTTPTQRAQTPSLPSRTNPHREGRPTFSIPSDDPPLPLPSPLPPRIPVNRGYGIGKPATVTNQKRKQLRSELLDLCDSPAEARKMRKMLSDREKVMRLDRKEEKKRSKDVTGGTSDSAESGVTFPLPIPMGVTGETEAETTGETGGVETVRAVPFPPAPRHFSTHPLLSYRVDPKSARPRRPPKLDKGTWVVGEEERNGGEKVVGWTEKGFCMEFC